MLAKTDIVCLPSTCEDSFPNGILEGMAAGKPVVASRVGGIPELVEDGRTGVLFRGAVRVSSRRDLPGSSRTRCVPGSWVKRAAAGYRRGSRRGYMRSVFRSYMTSYLESAARQAQSRACLGRTKS